MGSVIALRRPFLPRRRTARRRTPHRHWQAKHTFPLAQSCIPVRVSQKGENSEAISTYMLLNSGDGTCRGITILATLSFQGLEDTIEIHEEVSNVLNYIDHTEPGPLSITKSHVDVPVSKGEKVSDSLGVPWELDATVSAEVTRVFIWMQSGMAEASATLSEPLPIPGVLIGCR